jgi:hypothetical protein
MKLLIELPKEVYEDIRDTYEGCGVLEIAVKYGEPLPHGEWIEKEDFNQDIYYDCSICGNSWCTLDGTPWQNGMNFCPNCGASMKEGDEE